jgi:hypothetical protein
MRNFRSKFFNILAKWISGISDSLFRFESVGGDSECCGTVWHNGRGTIMASLPGGNW